MACPLNIVVCEHLSVKRAKANTLTIKCKKAKWFSEEALQKREKLKRKEEKLKAKEKRKIYPFEWRVSKNSKER